VFYILHSLNRSESFWQDSPNQPAARGFAASQSYVARAGNIKYFSHIGGKAEIEGEKLLKLMIAVFMETNSTLFSYCKNVPKSCEVHFIW